MMHILGKEKISILKIKASFIAFLNLIATFFFEGLLNYVLQNKSKNFYQIF